jgi:tRNA threonylcarbamoyladenosine biosynthesis protein TsaE
MKPFEVPLRSPEETRLLGQHLGRLLRPGSTVALEGAFGSGKTTLVQGIAMGLGVRQSKVKSPTFVFFHIYTGIYPIYHFDLYRVEKLNELEEIGFYEYAGSPEAVTLIEWADRATGALPADYLHVQLRDMGGDGRSLTACAAGRNSAGKLNRWISYERARH